MTSKIAKNLKYISTEAITQRVDEESKEEFKATFLDIIRLSD
jgi:hypothetical protein